MSGAAQTKVTDRLLSWLYFLIHKFSKNERRACDRRVWPLELPKKTVKDLL